MPVFGLSVKTTKTNGTLAVYIDSKNVDSFDFYVDGRPEGSKDVNPQTNSIAMDLVPGAAKILLVQGFKGKKLVVARCIGLQG
jgi:hypothetical protein